ncbi:hypothetical protein [Martelella radicis]|uniref:Uncharacterized protein n=1 Tax=Martelella radicis TaxID=1397476 RepID=A0A7W6KKE7_9HYPH|nr:hypothetical protein [Martelella radicis]MBB4122958.1 hypothetical protein [Martelella radicis]
MHRSEFEAVKSAVSARLLASAQKEDWSELELAAAVSEVWVEILDLEINAFLQRLTKRIAAVDGGISVSNDAARKATRWAGASWKRQDWQGELSVRIEFGDPNYYRVAAGIRAYCGPDEQRKPIDSTLWGMLKHVNVEELNLLRNREESRPWWPFFSRFVGVGDLKTPAGLAYMRGGALVEGRLLEEVLAEDLLQLVRFVDTVLEEARSSSPG